VLLGRSVHCWSLRVFETLDRQFRFAPALAANGAALLIELAVRQRLPRSTSPAKFSVCCRQAELEPAGETEH
jgi:hypothetical protein